MGISIIRRLPPHNLGHLNKINRHRVKVPVSEFVVSDVVNLSIELASIVKRRVTREKKFGMTSLVSSLRLRKQVILRPIFLGQPLCCRTDRQIFQNRVLSTNAHDMVFFITFHMFFFGFYVLIRLFCLLPLCFHIPSCFLVKIVFSYLFKCLVNLLRRQLPYALIFR